MTVNLETLEKMIDADGAWNVLLALEIILDEKAEHLLVNWQDKRSAAVYRRMAAKAGKLAREFEQASV